jgi:RNA polymerase sigma-70 factor (ECF subfamily)
VLRAILTRQLQRSTGPKALDMSSADGEFRRCDGSDEIRLEELIAAARTGSDSALGGALTACRARLMGAARSRLTPALRSLVGASDVVQDTFVNATRSFQVFRGQRASQFLNWLRRILFNRIAQVARREQERKDGGRQIAGNDVSRRLSAFVAVDEASPSGIAGSEEISALIRLGLAKLPERDQQALQLRFDEELNFAQIGERLGLTEDATRMLFGRAVDRLRRELTNEADKMKIEG